MKWVLLHLCQLKPPGDKLWSSLCQSIPTNISQIQSVRMETHCIIVNGFPLPQYHLHLNMYHNKQNNYPYLHYFLTCSMYCGKFGIDFIFLFAVIRCNYQSEWMFRCTWLIIFAFTTGYSRVVWNLYSRILWEPVVWHIYYTTIN